MEGKEALRFAGYYVALSTAALLVGLGIVGAGVYLGLDDVLRAAVGRGSTLAAARAAPGGVALGVLGVLVWQFGRAAVFHKTVSEAVDAQMRERFDSEMVKSEILTVLDDRLSDMDAKLEDARQTVQRLDSGEEAGFDFGD